MLTSFASTMNSPTVPVDTATHGGYAGALERGRRRRIEWTQHGTLLSAEEFAKAQGIPAASLVDAEARHEVFSVLVEGRRWYAAELLKLGHAATAAICGAMVGVDATRMLIFVLRKHGGLAGRTVSEAVATDELPRVLQLAEDWQHS